MKENFNLEKKNTFEFCKKEVKSLREDVLCKQDTLHKSLVDNPLSFIIFYVFSVFFIAFLFQLSKKGISSKEKKNK